MVRCDSKASNEVGQGASVSPSKKLSPGKVLESNRPDKQTKAPNSPQSSAVFDAGALVRTAVAGLADASTRGYMTDDTLTLLRQECPGWDLYTLHADFETWVNADTSRLPANWQRAFIGYVRKWHERHRHQLRS